MVGNAMLVLNADKVSRTKSRSMKRPLHDKFDLYADCLVSTFGEVGAAIRLKKL